MHCMRCISQEYNTNSTSLAMDQLPLAQVQLFLPELSLIATPDTYRPNAHWTKSTMDPDGGDNTLTIAQAMPKIRILVIVKQIFLMSR